MGFYDDNIASDKAAVFDGGSFYEKYISKEPSPEERAFELPPPGQPSAQPGGIKTFAEIGDDMATFGQKALEFGKELVTGDKRREFEYPEIPTRMRRSITPGKGQIGARISLSRTSIGKVNILRTDTGIDFSPQLDKFGNAYITVDKEAAKQYGIDTGHYYVNRPGASMQDVYDLFTMGAIEWMGARLGAKGAGKLFPGSKILGALGVGGGTGGGAAAQDIAARQAGANEPLNAMEVLFSATFGFGGELTAIAFPFLRQLLSSNKMIKNGKLTREGEKALARAGIPKDDITPEFLAKFDELSRKAADPTQAAVLAEAQSLPTPVPLTRGDVTGDVRQQSMELAMEKGSKGKAAQEVLLDVRSAQSEAFQENIEGVAARVGGDPGGMESVQSALAAKAATAKEGVDVAYTMAREAPEAVLDSTAGVSRFATHLRAFINDTYEGVFEEKNVVERMLSSLENTVRGKGGAPVHKVRIRSLEAWNRRLNLAIKNTDKTEATYAALNAMKSKYDNFIQGALDKSLFEGEPETVRLWLRARGLAFQRSELFRDNKIVAQIIDTRKGELIATPTEAIHYIFNVSGLGGKKGAVKAVRKIRKILGKDSVEWAAFKEETFRRFFLGQDDNIQAVFSSAKFSKNYQAAIRTSPELWKEIFSFEERALIGQFNRVALRTSKRTPGATASNAPMGIKIMTGLLGHGILGRTFYATIGRSIGWIGEGVRGAGARVAREYPLGAASGVTGIGGAVASTLQSQSP